MNDLRTVISTRYYLETDRSCTARLFGFTSWGDRQQFRVWQNKQNMTYRIVFKGHVLNKFAGPNEVRPNGVLDNEYPTLIFLSYLAW